MSINSIETAVKYSNELDKLFARKSITGFFGDNAFAKKFVGAKTVMIPDVDFQGLADYDRDNGFARSSIRVSNTPYTMTMDRARSLQIDREDLDETGVAALAGKVLGEYVRQKVVPECDAYVLSKLAQIAIGNTQTTFMSDSKPFEALNELINEVRNVVGYEEELVAFINSSVYPLFMESSEFSKGITNSEFKKGDINTEIKSYNGVALIPVVSGLMHSEYDFKNDEAGGFEKIGVVDTLILVCPKRAVHLVKKTETMRIFTPEQNLEADAYKFDYRIYYDAFVKKSEVPTIWAAVSPDVAVELNSYNETTQVNGLFTLTASAYSPPNIEERMSYQWYVSENEDLSEAKKIKYAATAGLEWNFTGINEPGTYYVFARVLVNGLNYVDTRPCVVTVTE